MIWLSDFQSEILIILPNFPNLILKNCNKLLRKILHQPEIESGSFAFRASVLSLYKITETLVIFLAITNMYRELRIGEHV